MAISLLASNNAQTVLSSGISSTATTLSVNTGTGSLFPSPVSGTSFFKLTLIDSATGTLTEIVHVTQRSGDTMTIERGQEGTTPRIWSVNDIAANMMTAGTLIYMLDSFQPLNANLTSMANLVGGADKLPYFTGANALSLTNISAPGRSLIGQASIDAMLTYLTLGTAAKKNVGTGTGQIPDMSAWTHSETTSPMAGWRMTPDGYIEQWGQSGAASSGRVSITFPIAFPTECETIQLTELTASGISPGSNVLSWGLNNDTISTTGFSVTCSNSSSVESLRWRALGK